MALITGVREILHPFLVVSPRYTEKSIFRHPILQDSVLHYMVIPGPSSKQQGISFLVHR